MEPKYVSFITRLRCPKCGAPLFSSGREVWCSRQGSAEKSGCEYGVAATVTVREYLDSVQQQLAESEQSSRHY